MTLHANPRQMRPGAREAGSARGSAFPRLPLFGAIGLVVFAMAATLFGQTTEIGTVRNVIGTPLDMRDIVFLEHADGTVAVADASSGQVITRLTQADGGFARGALPAFKRMRLVEEADQGLPYRIIRWDSGAVSVSDTATGERIYLNAFGPDIVAQFEGFLARDAAAARAVTKGEE